MAQNSTDNLTGRFVLTGCTGFVGKELVSQLHSRNVQLLLVGRSVTKLRDVFSSHECCTYKELESKLKPEDTILHLATINNNENANDEKYWSINVGLVKEVAEYAMRAGVKRFVHFTSFHALDRSKSDQYTRSKRAAAQALGAIEGVEAINLYLPFVYGATWPGKLSFLNSLPRAVSQNLFMVFAAMRPTVDSKTIADWLMASSRIGIEPVVLLAQDQDENPVYRFVTRLIDICFATAVLLLLGWFLLAVWAIIKLESKGPAIFRQDRVGRRGGVFTCLKFRTMLVGTTQVATHELGAASLTRLGGFLRSSKIDELPQIFNIFRDQVSLVGPRPALPLQTELNKFRCEHGVLLMKPGITGYAQVNGVDMRDPLRLAIVDGHYKMLRSIALNLRIAGATFLGRGQGDKISK